MKKKTYLLAALLILLGCTLIPSCSEFDAEGDWVELDNPNDGQPTDSTAVYMLPTPQYIGLTAQQQDFAQDNNAFTLRFLKAVNDVDSSGKSFIYSPLSITYVLSMVNAAAEGQTSQEIEQTLGFMLGYKEAELDDVNAYCQTLIEQLPQTDPNVQLSMANAIFVNNDYTLKPKFQQDMQTYYHALAESLDFSSPETLGHINGWCNEQTRGMIPTILEKVNPDAMSYLLNAVYFKAGWTSKFDERKTKTENFTTESGKTIQMPLMHQNVRALFLEDSTYSAIEFCYGSGLWNMTIMLPKEGKTTDDIIDVLAVKRRLRGHGDGFCLTMEEVLYYPYEIDLKLPRFGTKSDTDDLEGTLKEVLRQMGIRQAFDSQFAQVPNLCEEGNAFISMMRQKAAIEVNEEGAKASAVTVAGIDLTTAIDFTGHAKVDFHANRPFVYAIQEASTGVILFVGKYTGE
ncbi:MAG: serpin family protein [Bacteroidaceae bacterium]|nr:serpin family protein [Bacteroidaceae bacterium]